MSDVDHFSPLAPRLSLHGDGTRLRSRVRQLYSERCAPGSSVPDLTFEIRLGAGRGVVELRRERSGARPEL